MDLQQRLRPRDEDKKHRQRKDAGEQKQRALMDESSEEEDGSFRVSDLLVSEKEDDKEEEGQDETDEDDESYDAESVDSEEKGDEEEEDEDEKEAAEEQQVPERAPEGAPPEDKKEGEEELEFDDPEQPDKEEAYIAADEDAQLPAQAAGKADKLRRRSTAITKKTKQRLEKLKATKHRPGKFDGILSREQEEKLEEQEIIAEALLEWKLECHEKIQKYKDKIKKARWTYRRRYEKQQKKIEIHVRKNNQAAFM